MTLLRKSNRGRHTAVFLCKCGNEFVTYKYNVFSGHTKSCGCSTNKTHGQSRSMTYKAWTNMKSRCDNKNTPYYPLYGGRGIRYCAAWRTYEAFLRDMGECSKGLSLDRINVNGNYTPSNCRWATTEQQATNKRNNNRSLGDLTISQAARKAGIKQNTLLYRLKRGWNALDACFMPVSAKKKKDSK